SSRWTFPRSGQAMRSSTESHVGLTLRSQAPLRERHQRVHVAADVAVVRAEGAVEARRDDEPSIRPGKRGRAEWPLDGRVKEDRRRAAADEPQTGGDRAGGDNPAPIRAEARVEHRA